MVDLMDKLHKLTEMGRSTLDKQNLINVNEVFYIWDILTIKLDILENVQIFDSFIEDKDLKWITHQVVKVLEDGIKSMEELVEKYGIPFPTRPPAGSNSTIDREIFTDRYIYQTLFEGIQSFFPLLSSGFMNTTSPTVRKTFKTHLFLTMDLQETIVEYGKLKGYLNEPPAYGV